MRATRQQRSLRQRSTRQWPVAPDSLPGRTKRKGITNVLLALFIILAWFHSPAVVEPESVATSADSTQANQSSSIPHIETKQDSPVQVLGAQEFNNSTPRYLETPDLADTDAGSDLVPIVWTDTPTGAFANCSDTRKPITDDEITVACRTFNYRAPVDKLRNLSINATDSDIRLVFGVLSSYPERRQNIRETWAKYNPPGSVYFLLAGEWTAELEEENETHQDLVWFGYPDTYLDIMYKTVGFFTVMQTFAGHYFTHAFKTDDDSFINVPLLAGRLSETQAEYFGRCQKFSRRVIRKTENEKLKPFVMTEEEYPEPYYPVYCQGSGYAASNRFAKCIAQEASIVRFLKIEDQATGLLAQRCNVSFVDDKRITHKQEEVMDPGFDINQRIVVHKITSRDEIFHLDQLTKNAAEGDQEGEATENQKVQEEEEEEDSTQTLGNANASLFSNTSEPVTGDVVPIVWTNTPSGAFANCSDTRKPITADEITVACRTFNYRAPVDKLQNLSIDGADSDVRLVFGVLSSYPERRQNIRETWAKYNPLGSVYFLLAGDWTAELEEENEAHQDLVWFGYPDTYLDIMYKTVGFFTVMQTFAGHYYTHAFKTDDDSFVNVPLLADRLSETHAEYFGRCQKFSPRVIRKTEDEELQPFVMTEEEYPEPYFPAYCQGSGYAVSNRFAKCIAQEASIVRFLKIEDQATGLLAQRCGFSFVDDKRVTNKPEEVMDPGFDINQRIVVHKITARDEIFHLDQLTKNAAEGHQEGEATENQKVQEEDDSTQTLGNTNASLFSNTSEPVTGDVVPIVWTNTPSGAFANCSDTRKPITADEITVACRTFNYRAPVDKLQNLSIDGADSDVRLVFGVLSSYPERRQNIRETWAKYNPLGSVYFLLAGDWTAELEEENETHQDLVWFGYPDTYLDIMYKTVGFFTVMQTFAGHYYTHAFKTDDDSFVNVPLLADRLSETHAEYFGRCQKFSPRVIRETEDEELQPFVMTEEEYPEPYFPAYCQGSGYAVSNRFAKCIAQEASIVRFLKIEDQATGLLAQRCGFSFVDDKRVTNKPEDVLDPAFDLNQKIVVHKITAREEIFHLDQMKKNSVQGVEATDAVHDK